MSPRYWRWDDGNRFTWDQLERGGMWDSGLGQEQGRRGRVPQRFPRGAKSHRYLQEFWFQQVASPKSLGVQHFTRLCGSQSHESPRGS